MEQEKKIHIDSSEPKCANCFFYEEMKDVDAGFCFLNPPIHSPNTNCTWVRPRVRNTDYCGSFKRVGEVV